MPLIHQVVMMEAEKALIDPAMGGYILLSSLELRGER